ncbi:MAG TPA: ATPase, T2SS/T4P/T4SS family, partial [Candidatus Manganitrophaceae bacterium]
MKEIVKGEGRKSDKKKLGDLLVEIGFLAPAHLQRALSEQKKTGKRLGEILIQLQMVSESRMAQALASQVGMRYVEPGSMQIDPELFLLIPESLAKRHLAVPIEVQNKKLTLAMVDPLDYESINDLRFHAGMAITPVVATRKEILETIERSYHLETSVEKIIEASAKDFGAAMIEIVPELGGAEPTESHSLEERSRLAPVIQLTNLILSKAMKLRASDIHIEPGQAEFRVRYRIDGLLKEDMRLPKWVQSPLLSRIKILAKLDISERRLPQDGAVRLKAQGREVDIRVSTLPTRHGEKMVLRILDPSKMLIQLDQIGLFEKELNAVQALIKKKKGMILVTGPTGSGKTTTLYGIINELRSETNNLTTVEDPVEYTIDGINQVQINPDIGFTFASSLRSILRQDPNIILVGEIRDLETAEIAFRAAMTGHLVLSTLHTNDAASTISRLINIGVPRYLVSSTVAGIIAQRLVRKLCLRCKPPHSADPINNDAPQAAPLGGDSSLLRESGCSACHYTGFSGRVGLFEVMTVGPKLKELISAGATDQEIRAAGYALGMTSMEEDGLRKVQRGMTTFEEVARVAEME